MSPRISPKRATIARVVHDARRRRVEQSGWIAGIPEFKLGDTVRSTALFKNDGIDPHRDIGETLVHKGDAGIIRQSWSFLGEIYYTVEFATRAVVVIMRGREMVRAAWST
ncbi:nitrogen fixation protein NifZ [Bradyrhizobium sp.]|uniref:nitrogen fixation protein NifZ n=1 Tax=Bradyrhizobium sp. TaxID=376 RepID=UPI0040376A88